MSTFKTALRMALAHPLYLLIYTVFISLMGVFIAASVSWNSSQLTEYKPYDANVIVVDRDGSDLSLALTKHLGSRFDLVTGVGDDTYDLADALAKSNSAKGSACSSSTPSTRSLTSSSLPRRQATPTRSSSTPVCSMTRLCWSRAFCPRTP